MEKGTGVYLESFSSFILEITSCLSSCLFLTKCTVFKVLKTTDALGKGQSFTSVQCHTQRRDLGLWLGLLFPTATRANSNNIFKLNKNYLGKYVQERPNIKQKGGFFLF